MFTLGRSLAFSIDNDQPLITYQMIDDEDGEADASLMVISTQCTCPEGF
jgi:hypothetical protein